MEERLSHSVPETARATGYSEPRIRRSIREGHLKEAAPAGRATTESSRKT